MSREAPFGVGIVCVIAGMFTGWILTKRGLDARRIPNWPIVVGALCGIVGMFVLPALGLPIGFVVGLVGLSSSACRTIGRRRSTPRGRP